VRAASIFIVKAFNRHTTSKKLSLPHNSPSSQKQPPLIPSTRSSLSKNQPALFEQTMSKLKPLSVHMASFGNSSSDSGMAVLDRTTALQAQRTSAISGAIPVFGPPLPGTGFETLPPLAILFKPFQFLRFLSLKSVGLGFNCIPFHSGWKLVE